MAARSGKHRADVFDVHRGELLHRRGPRGSGALLDCGLLVPVRVTIREHVDVQRGLLRHIRWGVNIHRCDLCGHVHRSGLLVPRGVQHEHRVAVRGGLLRHVWVELHNGCARACERVAATRRRSWRYSRVSKWGRGL